MYIWCRVYAYILIKYKKICNELNLIAFIIKVEWTFGSGGKIFAFESVSC